MSPQQLDTLVAPIALYPDPLLSQIMVAATYPAELQQAQQWLAQNPGLSGQQLADAARQQNWDPSIQALVVFPDVVAHMTADMRWTTDLGNAFLAQQADVMAAVQRMRSRAMAAGKLQSNAQETVTTQVQGGQQAIDIAPANPEVIYVPYYNPTYIWGPPAWGYYPAWDLGFGFGFGWGPGIYIGSFFPGIGWGGWGWGFNWFNGFIYTRPFFFSHYGFRGYYGGRNWGGYSVWAHNPNRGLAGRYGNFGAANRSAGGWNHFNGAAGRSYNAQPSYRPPSASYNRSFMAPRVQNSAPSYNRSYTAPSYHYSAPSYSRSYSAPSYHYSAPSYSRSYSAPSYHYSAPSSGRSYSAPSYHSSAGSSGGGFHSSGGGGGFHGGGGGGSHGGHR
jgi:uncharacterized membrane protein YgcG